jgi:hypothetical protein
VLRRTGNTGIWYSHASYRRRDLTSNSDQVAQLIRTQPLTVVRPISVASARVTIVSQGRVSLPLPSRLLYLLVHRCHMAVVYCHTATAATLARASANSARQRFVVTNRRSIAVSTSTNAVNIGTLSARPDRSPLPTGYIARRGASVVPSASSPAMSPALTTAGADPNYYRLSRPNKRLPPFSLRLSIIPILRLAAHSVLACASRSTTRAP